MARKRREGLPHDATPDIHQFSSPPESVGELINMYGTYNVQRTCDTDNLFPMIAHALPTQWKGMAIGKQKLSEGEETAQ